MKILDNICDKYLDFKALHLFILLIYRISN